MKENLKHPLVIVFSIFIFLFLFAKFAPSFPISVTTQQKGEPFVVQGTGKVAIVPDIARITLGIEESGTSLKDVQNKVNQKSQDLTGALKKLGIGEKEIKTTSYNVYPEYNYNERLPRITGYRVSISYEVKITDFDKVNDVLVAATSTGANVVGGIYFEVNDKTRKEKLQEAREEAVKEAKEKAEGLAKAAGISLGKIINISEEGFEPRPIPLMEKIGAGGEPTPPEITPGETEITVTVSLSYEIR